MLLGARSKESYAKKLIIELSDADASRLHAEASRLGVSDEDLARAVVTDLLSQQMPIPDRG